MQTRNDKFGSLFTVVRNNCVAVYKVRGTLFRKGISNLANLANLAHLKTPDLSAFFCWLTAFVPASSAFVWPAESGALPTKLKNVEIWRHAI